MSAVRYGRSAWICLVLCGALARSVSAAPTFASNPADGGTLAFGPVLIGSTGRQQATTGGNSGALRIAFTPPAGPSPGFGPYTSLPAGASSFVSLAAGASQSQTYSFAPDHRGTYAGNTAAILSLDVRGSRAAPLAAHTFSLIGTGAAPVNHVSSTPSFVRLGTQGAATITIQDVGDGNLSGQPASGVHALIGGGSNLNGTVQAWVGGGSFAGRPAVNVSLADGASQQIAYAFTPQDRSLASAEVHIDFANGDSAGQNRPQSVTAQLQGQGVGPSFHASAAPGSLLDLGLTPDHLMHAFSLAISNVSTDPALGDSTLADLTILGAHLTGSDASQFTLSGFAPGMVLHEGDAANLQIEFTSSGSDGPKSAMLFLQTDQGAAFGRPGAVFMYPLVGFSPQQVPEPGSWLLLALGGLLALALRARRRRDAH